MRSLFEIPRLLRGLGRREQHGSPPRRHRLGPAARGALAMLAPLLALLLQREFQPILRPPCLSFFYPAVFLGTWVAGPWVGLAATTASAALGLLFFLPPATPETELSRLLPIGVFCATGLLFCVFQAQLRRANRLAARAFDDMRTVSEDRREMSERLRELVEHAPDGVFIADLDGRYTEVNLAACRMLGRSREQLIGKTILDLIPLDDIERLAQARERLLAGGREHGEWTLLHADGTNVPVEITATILSDGRWQAFVRDIRPRKDALRELREAKELLQNVLESSTEYSIVAEDLGGRIVLWNEGARRSYGYSTEEALGMPSSRLRAPEATEKPEETFQVRALERGQVETIVRRQRKNGTSFTARVVCTRRAGANGDPSGVLTIGRDVTQEERQLKEREILAWIWETLASSLDYHETQQRVARLAVDLLGDLGGVIEVREDGRVGRVFMLHADPARADLAKQFESTLERSSGAIVRRVVETRRPVLVSLEEVRPLGPADEELRALHAAMGTRSILALPLVSGGRLLGALGLASASPRYYDEEHLQLAEELARRAAVALDNARLYEQSRFQAAVTANLAEGVMAVRVADERIVYANPRFEQMFRFGPGELVGGHVSILNAPTAATAGETARQIVHELESGGAWHGEIENVRKDGTTFWCTASVASLDHPDFGPVWLAVHTDITERKRLEEANIRALREKEVLLKEVHHRVKNNLQIVSSLFYLQRQRVEDDQIRSLLDESRNRIESIALIHEQLYQSTSLSDIDFDDYLKRLCAALLSTFGTGQIDARTSAAGVVLDVEQAVPCALLISELLSNSLKHAFRGRGGAVWVRAHVEDAREVVVEAGDDGAGIPESVDWRSSRGLGLQLVQSLAKQLRGSIELDRSRGTRFTLRFGLRAAATQRARQLGGPAPGAAGSVK